MKAAVIEKYGSVEPFLIKDLPLPQCKEGQIVIRNKASSVNPIDAIVKEGSTRLITGLFGDHVLGSDFSGVVIQSRSTWFKEGDEVFGFISALKGGAYAEEMAVDARNAVHKPKNISFKEAAVLPLVSLTAWQGMLYDGKMKSSDHVLITGCTGGVGSIAVQIAKKLAFEITGVCSSKHIEFAQSLGCNHVINYEQESIPQNQEYDLFYDAAGKYTASDFKNALSREGMFVSTRGGVENVGSAIELVADLISKPMKVVRAKPASKDLLSIKQMVEEETIKPIVYKSFTLEQLNMAFRTLGKESFVGKIAIEI